MKTHKGKKEVLLLGGAFDPVHIAHRVLATVALTKAGELYGSSELWFLPCYSDAFGKKALTAPEHRIAMLEIMVSTALQHNPRYKVCTHEIDMANDAGTYAVVRSLIRTYPDVNFRYVIGFDLVEGVRKWRNSRDLLKTIPFMVFDRQGMVNYSNHRWIDDEYHYTHGKHLLQNNISSTEIREDFAKNREVWRNSHHVMLDPGVHQYINQHNLYTGPKNVAGFTDNF